MVIFVNWLVYMWNEAKWGKELLENYWSNYYFSSSQHKWTENVAYVYWWQRQQRPFLCSFVAALLLCSKRIGKGQGKDGGQMAYWKVGNTRLVPLGWWEVILGNGGEWWDSGFLLPQHQWSGADPSRTQEVLPSNTISCFCGWSAADQRAAAPKWTKTLWNFIHKIIMEVLQAKLRCLPQLLRSLTPAGPRSWLSSLMSLGLGVVARFRQHLRQFPGTPGSSSFTVSSGSGWLTVGKHLHSTQLLMGRRRRETDKAAGVLSFWIGFIQACWDTTVGKQQEIWPVQPNQDDRTNHFSQICPECKAQQTGDWKVIQLSIPKENKINWLSSSPCAGKWVLCLQHLYWWHKAPLSSSLVLLHTQHPWFLWRVHWGCSSSVFSIITLSGCLPHQEENNTFLH